MIKSLILLNLTILSLSTTFAHLLFSGFPPYYFRHRVEIQDLGSLCFDIFEPYNDLQKEPSQLQEGKWRKMYARV